MKGFTFIELLIVFAFIGIITSLGIASYGSYNSAQSVQSAASDVATLLTTAKSRAISQVVPSACGSNSLTGYQVDVTVLGQLYTLSAICNGKQIITSNMLSTKVMFANGSTSSVFFAVSNGTVAAPATILVTGFGKTKTITVNATGNITIN